MSPSTPRVAGMLLLTAMAVPAAGCAGESERAPAPVATSSSARATVAPLPASLDGANVGSCRDGACQILVTGPVTVPVRDIVIGLSAQAGTVLVETNRTGAGPATARLDRNGESTVVGRAAEQIRIQVVGLNRDGAVVDIGPT